MEPKTPGIVERERISHHIGGDFSLRPPSAFPTGPTRSPQRSSYTFHDIFLDPDPRIPLWERIKGGASLSLLPLALFCGGVSPEGTGDAGVDAGAVASGKDAGRSDGPESDGEIQCNPDNYIAENYNECGLGVCRGIVPATFCADGRIVPNDGACVPRKPLTVDDTTCDRIDDDCDGQIDEDYERPTGEPCGLPGACQGAVWVFCGESGNGYGELSECRGWSLPETPFDLCGDGIDNNCDGSIDENNEQLGIGEECSVGEGACRREGVFECTADDQHSVCSVVPGEPTGRDDNDCNRLDDDCDGIVDEGRGRMDIGMPCSVGVGVCRRNGERICAEDGEGWACSAVPGRPTGIDDDCDRIDEDCDGIAGEHFVPIPTENTCGEGACQTTSELHCVGGVLEESECEPRMPTVCNDYNCDGIDDDCNGEADEAHWLDIVRGEEGVCGSVAITSECVDGSLAITSECIDDIVDDDAVILSPLWNEADCPIHIFPETAWESNCDGYDEDDDGEIDEDFQPIAAVCREGENFSAGHLICTDGSLECVSDSY